MISKQKQNVIDAAIRVLNSHAIQDVTMRNIAKEAGVTTGSIYHHYKNKDELILDAMQQSFHFTTRLYETIETDGLQSTPQELLHEIKDEVGTRISRVERQILHIHLFSYMMKKEAKIKDQYLTYYKQIIDSTAELLMKAYDIKNIDTKNIIASLLVAAMDGVAMQQSLGLLPEDLEEYIKVFTDFFTTSLETYLKK